MSTYRTDRIDRDSAEQLLRGGPATRSGTQERLAALLAAAAAPAAAYELAGEEAALVAFRAARLAPAADPRRPSMIQVARAKLLTLKVGALTLAATAALGGVALAAGTGTLPSQGRDKTPASTAPSQSGKPHAGAPGGDARPRPHATKPSKPTKAHPAGSPSPSMVGLCRAYDNHPPGKRGKALQSPAFRALLTAAGGKDRVATYCAAVLAEHDRKSKGNGPDDKPRGPRDPGKPPKTKPAHP